MNTESTKCVMIIDESLPLGIIANTAAILGITLGSRVPEAVGEDVFDKNGNIHLGIIKFPVPVLKGNIGIVRNIRQKLCTEEFREITAADFSDTAQSCKTYDEYIEKIGAASEEDLHYMGLCLCGERKKINKLTANLPLLR